MHGSEPACLPVGYLSSYLDLWHCDDVASASVPLVECLYVCLYVGCGGFKALPLSDVLKCGGLY